MSRIFRDCHIKAQIFAEMHSHEKLGDRVLLLSLREVRDSCPQQQMLKESRLNVFPHEGRGRQHHIRLSCFL